MGNERFDIDTSQTEKFSKPELIVADNNKFLMVVNNHGLDKLVENGFLTGQQQKRIYEEFGKQEREPMNLAGQVSDKYFNQRLFVIEATKLDDNHTVATRLYSGQYMAAENIVDSPGPPEGLIPGYHNATLQINKTLNLVSSGLPSQPVFESIELDKNHSPTKGTVEHFIKNQQKEKGRLASTNMQDAIAQAINPAHTPSTPEGYQSPATGGLVAKTPGSKIGLV